MLFFYVNTTENCVVCSRIVSSRRHVTARWVFCPRNAAVGIAARWRLSRRTIHPSQSTWQRSWVTRLEWRTL